MTATIPDQLHEPETGAQYQPPDFGRSALINLGGCDLAIISSPDDIRNWVDEIIGRIKMRAFGEPNIVRFGEGDLYGDTHVQLIETSHIVVHTVHSTRCVFIDLFSCAAFDAELVRAEAATFFQARASRLGYFERTDPCEDPS